MATTKVKITNVLTKVIADGVDNFVVISPTGIPTPKTPVEEYESDMVTITDGTLYVPAYSKYQSFIIPFGAYTEFEVTNPNEVNYWENIKVDGAKIEVTDGNLAPAVEYTFTKVNITGTGTKDDPYKPEFEANKYFAPGADGGEPAQNATAIADDTGWGTTVTVVYTREKNVLPTNNVDGE